MGTAAVSKKSTGKVPMLIMLMLIYIVTYSYAATSISALTPYIASTISGVPLADVVTSGTQAGVTAAISALPLGIACFTFVAGVLMDKLSTRIVMFAAILFCGVAIFLRAANSFEMLWASMFLLGIGQAFVFPACTKVIASWFDRNEIYKFQGVLISAAPIGMIMGFNTSVPIQNLIGWQNIYRVLAVAAVIMAFVWLLIARDKKAEDVPLNQELDIDVTQNSVLANLKASLGSFQAWCLFLGEALYSGMIQTMIGLGSPILGSFLGADVAAGKLTGEAANKLGAFASSCGNLGSLIGYYFLPPIAEKVGLRKIFIWPSMIINALCLIIAFASGNIWIALIFFFVGYFFNGWSIPGPRSMLVESPGIAGMRAGTAYGVMLTLARLAAFGMPLLYSFINSLIGNMYISIMVIAAFAIVSAVFIMLAKETGMGREAAKKLQEEKKAQAQG
ncbi:MAG: MFS transporter [Ruminococcaceae bacterium]|nr:MFS transporter [Oscillospiraceae bacterium]